MARNHAAVSGRPPPSGVHVVDSAPQTSTTTGTQQMAVTPQKIRAYINDGITLALWVATTILVIFFVVHVVRMTGVNVPFVPKVDITPLVWAAGFTFLLKR